VRLKDGRTFIATDIKSDPKTDIAIVRLPAKETLPALKWGDSQSVEIGDHVLAVGAPFGLTGTVTHGIISGKGRSLNLHPYEDYVQTDAAINPGNSGGPLVTLDGKVVGVNSVIKSRSGGFQGVGLAVSSHLAKQVVDELMKNGAVARAYLGVKVGDLDKAVAERMGLGGKGGAVVADVLPDTPAAKAGLKDGDIITSLAGKPVPSAMDLTWSVWRLAAGKPVEVAILRDGKPITVTVTPEKQPDDFGLASESRKSKSTGPGAVHLEKIGAWAADFTAEMADRYGFKDRFDGAVIVRVDPSGWAAATGLRPGAVIVKVDDRPVATAREAAKAVADGSLTEGIQFQYRTALSGTGYLMIRSSRER
jgi:serine protease Do